MNDIYENIDECNPSKKRNMMIVSDDMIVDCLGKKISTNCNRYIYQKYKKKPFFCFYHAILHLYTKRH